ncbi:fluoroquinolone transport system permease protein [Sporosarcina luteola]|nr:fluoroquinolone transport system permease protein [Sporosarcina luteola]
MKLLNLLVNDMKFHLRHGFYIAYIVLTAMLLGILSLFPEIIKEQAAIILTITEIGSFGSTFIAATIILEKEQKLYDTLFITPLSIHSFIQAKVMALSIPALLSGMILFANSFGVRAITPEFIIGVMLTSILFSLLGFALATRCDSINGFILLAAPFGLLFVGLPLVHDLRLLQVPFNSYLPTQGAIQLIRASFEEAHWKDSLRSIFSLSVWIALFYIWAKRWFSNTIVWKGDSR